MKKVLFTGILISLLASCSTSTDQVTNAENKAQTSEKIAEKDLVTVIPNRMMTTEIDGMTCEMGCGGSIRKELLNTGAVARCSFDFKGIDETSSAMIEFDKDKISADEIADLIKELNEGQFTLGEMSTDFIALETEDEEETSSEATSSSEKEEISPINVSSSAGIQLPNLLELISEFLIG